MLYDWTAKRSGASMTITGTDATGAIRTILGVELIELTPEGPVAKTLTFRREPLSPTAGRPEPSDAGALAA